MYTPRQDFKCNLFRNCQDASKEAGCVIKLSAAWKTGKRLADGTEHTPQGHPNQGARDLGWLHIYSHQPLAEGCPGAGQSLSFLAWHSRVAFGVKLLGTEMRYSWCSKTSRAHWSGTTQRKAVGSALSFYHKRDKCMLANVQTPQKSTDKYVVPLSHPCSLTCHR